MASKFNSVEEVQQFFDQCVAFWQRQGDDLDVARCKAFWWDIVEISDSFDAWGDAKLQFANNLCGFKPGGKIPCEADVRSGNCLPGCQPRSGKKNSAFPKDRIYTVTFTREANNMIDKIVFNCWAVSVPDAKRIARETWEVRHRGKGKTPHMFHLEAHRASTQTMEDLRVTNWMHQDITGWDTMWTFIKTHSARRGDPTPWL